MVTKAVRQETFRIRGIYFMVIGLSWVGRVVQGRVGILFKWYGEVGQ